jgi:hypothetical protein
VNDSTAPYVPDLTRARPAAAPLRLGTLGGAGRSIGAGFDLMRADVGLTNTQQRYESGVWGEMIAAANRAGVAQPVRTIDFLGATMLTLPGELRNPAYTAAGRFSDREKVADDLLKAYQAARAKDPSLPDYGSTEAVLAEVTRRRQADAAEARGRMDDSALGIAGGFIGALGAGFTDPLLLATMGIGAGAVTGKTLAQTIAMRAAAEGSLQGALTVATLPVLFEDAEANDFDYDAWDAVLDVVLGTVLGGVIGAGSGVLEARAVKKAGRATAEAIERGTDVVAANSRTLARKLRELGRPLTTEEEDAARTLEAAADVEEATPFPAVPEGDVVHAASLDEAVQAIEQGRANALPDMPVLPPSAARVEADILGDGAGRAADLELADFITEEIGEARADIALLTDLRTKIERARLTEANRAALLAERDTVAALAEYEPPDGPSRQRLVEIDQYLDEARRLQTQGVDPDAVQRDLQDVETHLAELERELVEVRARATTPADPATMQSGRIYEVSAKDLQTDPVTFQYKGGGDAEGVTERLRGVTEWNPDAANTIIVWQKADGTMFVADGHQRSGLARRLIAEGRYADIKLTARVYREVDGFTAERIMLRAAGANILNGSGTEVDAAKIIRRAGVGGEYLQGFNAAAAFGKRAMGLSRLSDDAFGMVLNGTDADAAVGAIVGRVAADQPELHAQLLAAVRKADVTNENQMELMVRDMLAAPRTTETQTDMFGSLQVTRGLWAERAQVLDRAVRAIKGAKRALASAADNADVLEGAGSRVDRKAAASAADQNAVLAQAVERLAHKTDNPVNAALSRAAAMIAEGMSPDAAAKAFVNDLRARPDILRDIIAGGDGGRADGGDAGLQRGAGPDAAPEGRQSNEIRGDAGAPDADAGDGDAGGFDPDGALGSLFGSDDAAGGGGPARPAAGADGRPDGSLGLDGGPRVGLALAPRQAQQAQMGADSPLRPGDRAEQADVDGLPMFDAERSPDMLDALARDGASGRVAAEFDDPMGAGAQAQADVLLHDLRRDVKLEGDAPAREEGFALDELEDVDLKSALDGLDADEAALAALRGCL